MAVNLLMII